MRNDGSRVNRGGQELRAKLDALPHGAYGRLAKEMGVGPDVISRWLNGGFKPMTRQRIRLQELHGVDLIAWDEPPVLTGQNPIEAAG